MSFLLRGWFFLAAWLPFAAFASAGVAPLWVRPPITAQEVAQGYRNDVVLAQPLPANLGTVDAQEAGEGTVIRRVFPRFGAVRIIAVRPGETPAEAVQRLQATGRYRYVELDVLRHTLDTSPNDPDFGSQWGLANTGANSAVSGPGIAGADIHAEAAWDIRTSASNIIVATVDTGLLTTHDDIIANLWTNPDPTAKDGFDGADLHGIDTTTTGIASGTPTDTVGHGTHVAGIIGAVGNNDDDVSGVDWNVQIMALKFIGPQGGSTSDEITCLDYALSHGARIVNASYGSDAYSNSEFAAIGGLQQAGIIMVCAAANNSEDNDLTPAYPASYDLDNIVTVAASDNRDDLVFFSNYGSGNVDLAAPGYNILSLWYTSNTATQLLSGTSMATPMVTGSLALLEAQFPGDSYRQIINRLLRHADPNPNFFGRVATGGRLDLAAALGSAAGDNTPFNDAFAARSHLAGLSLSVRDSNAGATRESGEPVIAGNAGGASLWWDWTAPCSGPVTLSTAGSAYPTLIGVYTGTALGSLNSVTGAAGSSVNFSAQAGTTYEISVDGVNGASGLTLLALSYGNDAFSGALTLSGPSVNLTATNLHATAQAGEPHILGNTPQHSVWYAWTAPASGHYEVSAVSGDFDPLLAVYTGSSLTSLAVVGAAEGLGINSNATTPQSVATVGFYAVAGTTYQITVDGAIDEEDTFIDAGQFTLAIGDAQWVGTAADSFRSTPAVAPDGSVYIGGDDSVLYAFNPDGSTKWTYTAGGAFDSSSPAIGPDGTVYAGAEDGNLYAWTPSGTLKWTFPVADAGTAYVASSPAVASDGTIYIKDSVDTLYAVTPAGAQKWTAPVPGASYAAPTVGADGTIFIGSDDGNGGGELYAFNADGSSKWTFNANSPIYTSAAVDAAGNVYFGTLGGTVYSVSPAGQQNWSFTAGNSVSSAPALGSDGTVYFGAYDRKLYALTAAGALKWTYATGGEIRASAPAIGSSGGQDLICIGSYDGNVYAVLANGSLLRTYASGGLVRSAPAIFGTTLYFGSADFHVYAYDTGETAAGAVWPMYQGGPQRAGRVIASGLAVTEEPTASVGLSNGSPLVLSSGAVGAGPLAYQWQFNGQNIAGATESTYVLPSAGTANYGGYDVVVTGSQGSVTSGTALVGAPGAPAIVSAPQSQSVNAGGALTLSVAATGGSMSYQWSFDGTTIAGATGATLTLTNVGAQEGSEYGSYSVTLSNGYGLETSPAAALTVVTSARLLNLSSRAQVLPGGASALVAGFTTANGDKNLVLRGIGPTLGAFGISTALADPTLTLYNSSQGVLDSNTGWTSVSSSNTAALVSAFAQVGAFALPLSGSADSALLENLAPASYTAQVTGPSNESGLALAEVYDDDTGTPAGRLVNLSSRAAVGTGANVLTAGFVISGATSETILVRGIGPTLGTAFSVPGVLTEPTLTVYDSNQDVLATNSGWGGNATLSAVFSQVNAFPLPATSADAALLITLPAGQYTAQVAGVGGTTGVALVEVYEVR